MHLFGAIKMACKSLWTNKLRSFLTMLGIIIGVMAVSLLSTVASGVTDAVISSIRSQSTLAAMMNTSSKLTFEKATDIIDGVQPDDENADNYFKYSLVYSNSTLVATAEKSILEADSSGILDFLTAEKLYKKEDFDYDNLTSEEKSLVDTLILKKKGALGTSIYAVDNNFTDVYDFKLYGNFPTNGNELLVDYVFLQTFFGGETLSYDDVIGRVITLGVLNYTQCVVTFSEDTNVTKGLLTTIVTSLKTGISVDVGEGDSATKQTIKFSIVKNDDGSEYIYNEATKKLTINVEVNKFVTNTEITDYINNMIKDFDAPYNKTTIAIQDIYDISNAKEFTITGVFDDSENSIVTSITSSISQSASDKMENSIFMAFVQSMSGVKGTCYTIMDNESISCLSKGEFTTTQESKLSFAYFRYKNEEVMNASTTNLIVSFSSNHFNYMTDFMLISFSSVANIISGIMDILTIMLTVISIISLIVGGIGIMNIMLVAVSERTREIGIRKAIGAKKSSILSQFLVEAIFISLIGGVIGLGISAIGTLIIAKVMDIALVMPVWVIFMSIGFCSAVGLIFGMFPAIKASNMQPIDALRRE